MTLLQSLTTLFLCFAIATAALVWIAKLQQARTNAQRRANIARTGCPEMFEPAPPPPAAIRLRNVFGEIESYEDAPPCGPFDAPTADREERRRSFAYGNLAIDRPEITRADIDRAAEAMARDINGETADERETRRASGPLATCTAPGVWTPLTPEQRAAISSWSRGDEVTEVAR